MTRPLTLVTAFLSLACAFPTTHAVAVPAEDAFIQIWGIHRQTPDTHETVLKACRETIQKRGADGTPLLGPYLPVVRTIEGWRLLMLARTAEAVKAFEAAIDPQRSSDGIVRAADAVARRWLSRLDRETVAATLKAYHREQVEFPVDLSVFGAWPKERQPPLRDRMGDPWVYRLTDFRRLKAVARQQYSLYSLTIGRETSTLDAALQKTQPDTPIAFVRKGAATPALVEFRIGTAPELKNTIIQEGNLSEGLRFVALDSQSRFALLTDSDFWLTALPAGGQR